MPKSIQRQWLKVPKKQKRCGWTFELKGEEKKIEADYVFVMVGSRPNTDEIGLEQIGVKVNDRGIIEIDKQCRTECNEYICNW